MLPQEVIRKPRGRAKRVDSACAILAQLALSAAAIRRAPVFVAMDKVVISSELSEVSNRSARKNSVELLACVGRGGVNSDAIGRSPLDDTHEVQRHANRCGECSREYLGPVETRRREAIDSRPKIVRIASYPPLR